MFLSKFVCPGVLMDTNWAALFWAAPRNLGGALFLDCPLFWGGPPCLGGPPYFGRPPVFWAAPPYSDGSTYLGDPLFERPPYLDGPLIWAAPVFGRPLYLGDPSFRRLPNLGDFDSKILAKSLFAVKTEIKLASVVKLAIVQKSANLPIGRRQYRQQIFLKISTVFFFSRRPAQFFSYTER